VFRSGYELKHVIKTKRKMELIMEFLKADKEEREAGHKDLLAKMATWKEEADANQAKAEAKRKADKERMEADRRDLKEMMKMMHANQTNTDAKLEGLSERIEKTQMALQTAEMCHDTTTKRLKEDLTKTYNEICERIKETKREF
jgi:hypothetical protein